MVGKVLIYGGSGGIGSATGRILHARGYELHLVGQSEEKLAPFASEFGAKYTLGDVNDGDIFSRAVKDAGEPLDGLVYAVGTINLRSIQRLTEADFLRDFRVNAVGAALAIQAALPALKKSEGIASVVLFSSIAVSQGFTFHASMGMAKGAVNGLTLSLAAELAPKVRINAIAPSLTRTSLASGILSNPQTATALAGLHPMEQLGTAEDIASLSAFLLSPEANWITGQIFNVDGGRSTLRPKG